MLNIKDHQIGRTPVWQVGLKGISPDSRERLRHYLIGLAPRQLPDEYESGIGRTIVPIGARIARTAMFRQLVHLPGLQDKKIESLIQTVTPRWKLWRDPALLLVFQPGGFTKMHRDGPGYGNTAWWLSLEPTEMMIQKSWDPDSGLIKVLLEPYKVYRFPSKMLHGTRPCKQSRLTLTWWLVNENAFPEQDLSSEKSYKQESLDILGEHKDGGIAGLDRDQDL